MLIATVQQIFSEKYLLRRPLLEAIQQDVAPVLLIDEIDRADEEFEAFLLELLSDFQISIPELGTVNAVTKPLVVLTANGKSEPARFTHAEPTLSWSRASQELSNALIELPEPRFAARQLSRTPLLLAGVVTGDPIQV